MDPRKTTIKVIRVCCVCGRRDIGAIILTEPFNGSLDLKDILWQESHDSDPSRHDSSESNYYISIVLDW